jgi:predicted RNase H-like nuclease (RuvC/YqgF family)
MSNKTNRDSALVKAVLALDNHLNELERVGMKINSTDMTSDFDLEYIQKLMARFAECGQGISEEVTNLSTQLQEAQSRAQAVAQGVGRQAELFKIRREEQNKKLEEFGALGEKVRELNAVISGFREHPAELKAQIPVFETQLGLLIEDLQNLRQSARDSRMRALEKNAESLIQTLQAARKKLRDLSPPATDSGVGQN